jgi:endoglycosylceramidase
VQDVFAQQWQHVAARFKDSPYVLGYDILNEPYPGEDYPYPVGSCWNPAVTNGCPEFDALLAAFNSRIVNAIHAVDPAHIVWYEAGQHVYTGRPNHLSDHPVTGPAGLSLHAYCLEALGVPKNDVTGAYCDGALENTFAGADSHADITDDALLVSEFGATKDPGFWTQLTSIADRHMVPWTMWSYSELAGGWNTPGEPTADPAVQAAVVRPYPVRIAGTPAQWAFDTSTNVFTLRYHTTSPTGEQPTDPSEIFVPALHYANGYVVSVSGATVVSQPGADTLVLRNLGGADEVNVTVAPV